MVGLGISVPSTDGPENGWLEDDRFLFGKGIFSVATLLVSGSVHPLQVFTMDRRNNEWFSNKDSAQGVISSSTVGF